MTPDPKESLISTTLLYKFLLKALRETKTYCDPLARRVGEGSINASATATRIFFDS